MDHPILDLDTAVPDESIVDLDDAPVAFTGGGTFEVGVQCGGDQVL